MFDVASDSMYAWFGLAVVSVAVLGTALRVPAGPPPDARAVADAVDTASASPHAATAAYPVDAEAVKIGPSRISLRGPGGTAHATFAFGPVTPVAADSPLQAILRGSPPPREFASPAAFRRACKRARNATPAWESSDRVVVRTVVWEGVDVTLVSA